MLTEEQREIIEETISNKDGVYAVKACAGSGKSFTVFKAIDYIKEHEPNARILYLVFNKANQVSASQKLRKYATWPEKLQPVVSTAHSYAFKKWLSIFGPFQSLPAFNWNVISEVKENKKYDYAPDIRYSKRAPFDKMLEKYEASKLTLDTFCEEWELKFDDTYEGTDKPRDLLITNNKGVQMHKFGIEVNGYSCITERHIDAFKDAYKLHLDHKLFTHGMYLKHTAYSPKAGGDEWDYVFFDEAQDSNYFMLKLLEKQTIHKLYFVGDERQSIYRFGGSNENVFTTRQFDKQYTLSKSFRFGEQVANLANKIVHLNTPEQTCYGTDQTHDTDKNSVAYLYRTNAKLFQDALDIAYVRERNGDSFKIDFLKSNTGDDDLVKYDELLSFLGLFYYYTDLPTYRRVKSMLPDKLSPSLIDFEKNLRNNHNFYDVYNEQYDYLSDDLHSMFNYAKDEKFFIEKYQALRNCLNRTVYDSKITMITMHRAKGMEWDIVYVNEPTKLYYKDKEGIWRRNSDPIAELNLAYVAITRARKELHAQALFDELSMEKPIFNEEEFDIVLPNREDLVAIDVAI